MTIIVFIEQTLTLSLLNLRFIENFLTNFLYFKFLKNKHSILKNIWYNMYNLILNYKW